MTGGNKTSLTLEVQGGNSWHGEVGPLRTALSPHLGIRMVMVAVELVRRGRMVVRRETGDFLLQLPFLF